MEYDKLTYVNGLYFAGQNEADNYSYDTVCCKGTCKNIDFSVSITRAYITAIRMILIKKNF